MSNKKNLSGLRQSREAWDIMLFSILSFYFHSKGVKSLNKIFITNNLLINEKYSKDYIVDYYDEQFIKILEIVRDKIHFGHKLITHPLSSSLKPNQTPYKTILITKNRSNLDINSLMIIENSIQTTQKFLKDRVISNWNEVELEDFQIVDFDLIEGALNLI